jgi:DNA-directed RNA polymerase specialized sigma24 family protein
MQKLGQSDGVAARELWNLYFPKLVRVAQARLNGFSSPAADAEDAALSAFNSFFQGYKAGDFPEVKDRTELWQLLATITVRKVNDYRKRHYAAKRGHGHVQHESALTGDDSECNAFLDQLVTTGNTPEFLAIMSETCQELLRCLEGEPILVTIAVKKLEGFSNSEIASQLTCSERSIERKLARIRKKWSERVSGG